MTKKPRAQPKIASTGHDLSESIEKLSGQYYILIGFDRKPSVVERTVITRSKKALLDRSIYRNVGKKAADVGQIVELLQLYKRLSGYAIVGNESAAELKAFHTAKLHMALANESGKTITLVKDAPKHRLYVSNSLDIKNVNRAVDKFWFAQRSGYAVNNAIFVGMVSMFDELVARLIRESLQAVPELINSFGMDVPYSEIVAAGDFEELKKSIIENTVYSLMWKGRSEQLKWIEKNISKNEFSKIIPNYSAFLEVAERRNIYVHNDGIVTKEYYERLKRAGVHIKGPEVGKRLPLNQEYFLSAANALIEAYVIISQSVIRKITKSASQDIKDAVDSQFSEAAYYQLLNERWDSAARIAKSVTSNDFSVADLTAKMATVNLAIATKKSEGLENCENILSKADWSSAKDEFKLCIAAIREDMDALETLVPKLKGSDWIDPSAYFEWPAFEWVRTEPRFWELLEAVYGDEIKKVADSDIVDSAMSTSELEDGGP